MGRSAVKSSYQVIVVEDDHTFLCFWERFLKSIGIYDFEIVSNPVAAEALLEKAECRLLISDINMPAVNGYQLAIAARKRSPECAVILTTAYGVNLSRFEIGMNCFHIVYKPYNNVNELAKLIKHLIAGDTRFDDLSEDSFSENEDIPTVTEWKL